MTSRFSSGEGSAERLQTIIDILTGDVRGIDEIKRLGLAFRQARDEAGHFTSGVVADKEKAIAAIQQLEARLQSLNRIELQEFSKTAKASWDTFAAAGKVANEPIKSITNDLRGIIDANMRIGESAKSAHASFDTFVREGAIHAAKLPQTMLEFGRTTQLADSHIKSAKQSFDVFTREGLIPVEEATRKVGTQAGILNGHFGTWMVTATNLFGTFSNLQGAMANMTPAAQILGQSIQEVGFGIAGIAMGGPAAIFGITSIAASALKTFTELGKASGEFANTMRVQAAVMGMTEKQTATLTTAMSLSGANVGQLQIFIQRLTKAMEDLDAGVDNVASRALQRLGVQTKNVNGEFRDSYDVLLDVQKALQGITNVQEHNAVAAQLSGMRSRETLALFKDMNTTLPRANELINQHSGLFEGLADRQKKFNDQQERMKLSWNEITKVVGPKYVDAIDGITYAFARLMEVASGQDVVSKNFNAQFSWMKSLDPRSYFRQPRGGIGIGEDSPRDMTLPPTSMFPDLDKWLARENLPPLGSEMSPEAYIKMWSDRSKALKARPDDDVASELARSNAASASSIELFHALIADMPKFAVSLGQSQKSINEWGLANAQFDARLKDIKIQTDLARAAQTRMQLEGQQFVIVMNSEGRAKQVLTDAYQAAEDRIKALTAAEHVLSAERAASVGVYADSIKALNEGIKEAAKTALEARQQFAPFLAKSLGTAASSGGTLVTGGSGNVTWSAIVRPGETTSLGPGPINIPTGIPGAASGGFVAESGVAVIHKGETITPAGVGGNITINVTSLDARGAADAVLDAIIQLRRTGRM